MDNHVDVGRDVPAADVVELVDAKAIRAIAHPARLVVIDALYDRGLALTATSAAELAGITPSAMSYHLRALERFGIVRRGTPTGDGRERAWVRSAKDLRIRASGAGSDRAMALATGAVVATALDVVRERLLAAIERSVGHNEARRPLDAITQFGNVSVVVTPDEAATLLGSFHEAIEPLRPENRTDVPEGAGLLSIVIGAFGEPDPTTRLRAPTERS
jgi:DNA-binding transcriptional ArsR family regulator